MSDVNAIVEISPMAAPNSRFGVPTSPTGAKYNPLSTNVINPISAITILMAKTNATDTGSTNVIPIRTARKATLIFIDGMEDPVLQ